VTGNFINPLSRRPRAGYLDATARLKTATRALLDLPDEVVISVTELACREPGMPGCRNGGRDPARRRKALHRQVPQTTARGYARQPGSRVRAVGLGRLARPLNGNRISACGAPVRRPLHKILTLKTLYAVRLVKRRREAKHIFYGLTDARVLHLVQSAIDHAAETQ
jgi:DNA-binding transcriptional ArsR family regulator